MSAPKRKVPLSGGGELRTPLLVPSISSAGFNRVKNSDGGTEPESAYWLRVFLAPFLRNALLISAYDLHYNNLPDGRELRDNFEHSIYAGDRLLFVDSGQYEKVYGPPPNDDVGRLDWNRDLHAALIAELDPTSRAIVVNYDGYADDGSAPFPAQIESAQAFFAASVHFSSDLLIKPERAGRKLDVDGLTSHMRKLRGFDLIGVTEKELGDSLLEKLCALVKLRARLTDAGVSAPIHVFGSLDPVLAPLYHAAGAEVFDGLTWLRYGYHWEAAMYRDQVPVLVEQQNLTKTRQEREFTLLAANLEALGVLGENMRQFASTGNWGQFGSRVADGLEKAHHALTTSMGE
jgi:hypothetical protein